MMNIGKRILLVTLIVLGSLVALLAIAVGLLNLSGAIFYSEFYSTAEADFDVPGLGDGFVPQGLCEVDGVLLVGGYMKGDGPSRIYLVGEDGRAEAVQLYKKNGEDFTGHCGGIAHSGDYFYVGGSGGLYVFSLSDLLDGDGKAKQIGKFDAQITASFVYSHGGYVYLGTFADGDKYVPDDWQSTVTPSGEVNPSIIARFRLNAEAEYGIEELPDCAYSIRKWVQGCAVTDDGIILSTSSGINTSYLSYYKPSEDNKTELVFGDDGGVSLPLYHLDSTTLTHTTKAIPMAEEIEVVGDRIYIVNESACSKYLFGILVGGQRFYHVEYNKAHFD
ncbi:MAG: hypothetical protein IKC32_03285 [Clostridia bacterium]|nr:hypothetical protein [Clostridia bacterium]